MDQIPTYKDEYWDDALKALKKEERKALFLKLRPVVIFLLVLIGAALLWLSLRPFAPAQIATVPEFNQGLLTYKAHNSIQDKYSNAENLNSIDESSPQNLNSDGVLTLITDVATTQKGIQIVVEASESDHSNQEKKAEVLEKSDKLVSNDEFLDMTSNIADVEDELKLKDIFVRSNNNADFKEDGPDKELYFMRKIGLPIHLPKTGIPVSRKSIGNFKSNRIPDRVSNIYLEFGTHLWTGFGTVQSRLNVNPHIGLGYEYQGTDLWSLSAGLSYYHISGSQYGISIEQTELGFGSNTVSTSIETNKLKYLAMPLAFSYHLGLRHSIGFNWTSSVLMDTGSNVSVSSSANTASELKNETGYTQGLNTLIHAAGAHYSFRLSPDFKFSVAYNQGLNKVNNTRYYSNTGNDLGSSVLLKLNYQLKP